MFFPDDYIEHPDNESVSADDTYSEVEEDDNIINREVEVQNEDNEVDFDENDGFEVTVDKNNDAPEINASQNHNLMNWYPVKKIVRPLKMSDEDYEKKRVAAEKIVAGKLSKFSRKRKSKYFSQTNRNESGSLEEHFNSQDTSVLSYEETSEGFITSEGGKSSSAGYNKKSTSFPSLTSQVDRIEQIKKYDESHGTSHAKVLKATKAGLQCEVCEGTYTDLSTFFRLKKSTNELEMRTHIGSQSHASNMEMKHVLASRTPSLYSLLQKTNSKVDIKVQAFRFELTQLLLALRVPLSAVNKSLFREFVAKNIGYFYNVVI